MIVSTVDKRREDIEEDRVSAKKNAKFGDFSLLIQINNEKKNINTGKDKVDKRLEGYQDNIKFCQPHSYLKVPTPEFDELQAQHLKSNLIPAEEMVQPNNTSQPCIFCTEYASTRMIDPCGHWMGCIEMPITRSMARRAREAACPYLPQVAPAHADPQAAILLAALAAILLPPPLLLS
ncbi:hypothetical protein LSTR_LSTR000835 [Laodelphax striatellus]|uniref:Uncharacterized protein n=1 Tax=Laodelphax striatellus TaxID=195883 RepID=A0A482X0I5_LAOST|nr:hypothetical protein LSTR_LSTR000835 [Laodelphax striatellus]